MLFSDFNKFWRTIIYLTGILDLLGALDNIMTNNNGLALLDLILAMWMYKILYLDD